MRATLGPLISGDRVRVHGRNEKRNTPEKIKGNEFQDQILKFILKIINQITEASRKQEAQGNDGRTQAGGGQRGDHGAKGIFERGRQGRGGVLRGRAREIR
jgi:hypothetical protein